MDRLHYLADPDVRGFTEYCRKLAVEGTGAELGVGRGRRRRPVTTLLQAQNAFRWRGRDFAEVSLHLDRFRAEMVDALAVCRGSVPGCRPRLAQYELLYVCTKILEWANCLKGVLGYLTEQAQAEALSDCVIRAAHVIDGDSDDTAAFDSTRLRSDPQIARLYAVTNTRTVAYNGRVAAALCLLCRHHRAVDGNGAGIPDLLDFRLASDRPRHDPSVPAGASFRRCPAGAEHARWNIRANWILDAVAADDTLTELGDTRPQRLRALEAALFMLGDDVRSSTVRSRRGPRAAAAHLMRGSRTG